MTRDTLLQEYAATLAKHAVRNVVEYREKAIREGRATIRVAAKELDLTPRERAILCTHEAGHAVAEYALGLPPFEYVSIRPAEELAAKGILLGAPRTWATMTPSQFRNEAVAYMAGSVAQERLTGAYDAHAESGDLVGACRAGLELGHRPEQMPDFIAAVRDEAATLIAARWPTITALANALASAKHLTYAQCLPYLRQGGN